MAEPVANWWLWILLIIIVLEVLLWRKEIARAIRKHKKTKNVLIAIGYSIGLFAILWFGMFAIFMNRTGLVPADTPIQTLSEWTSDCVKWATISSIVIAPTMVAISAYFGRDTRRRKR